MRAFHLVFFLLSVFLCSAKIKISDTIPLNPAIERLEHQVAEVKKLIHSTAGYNNKIAFLVDMHVKSGKNRFFVYDLIADKVIDQGLVAHGSGSETKVKGELQFSNEPNSKSTSLGKYSVGRPYVGMFGKAYKLHGLDLTNGNAEKRAIVLHSYSAVPYEEQDYYISHSHGCPMVNEIFFRRLEKFISASNLKIVLDVYY